MGAVACQKHGAHPGILCCDHVRVGAGSRSSIVSFVRYQLDLGEDRTTLAESLLCAACAETFSLSVSQPIALEVWKDPKRFPYVCPTCEQCLSEWQRDGRET